MPETREATIRKISHQNPGNSWAIVQTTDEKNPSWKGPIAEDLTPGTWLRAEGYLGPREGNWRPSFIVTKVLQLVVEKEDTGKSWMEWRLPEIGDVRSTILSEKYGEELPDFFDDPQASQRELASMRGLTRERVDKILDAYADHPNELRVMMWLGYHGLRWPANKATMLHYRSPETLRGIVEKDPYAIFIVEGVTFEAIDALGEGLGVDRRDPRRLRGLVWSKLEDTAGSSGDCYITRPDILAGLANYGYSTNEIEAILAESRHYQFLPPGVQLLRFILAERSIATRTHRMLRAEKLQEKLKLTNMPERLDASQREAVENLLQVPIAVLTGGPGTGKTTVLKTALDQMESRGERILLASPTGKAAKRMTETTGRPASTIHRLLGWKPPPAGWHHDASNPVDADVVVVDEASMLDEERAAALFEAIGTGTRLILVGDVNQLPPVGAGQPLLDILESQVVPKFVLTQTHRQRKDSWVIDNAPRILQGKMPSLRAQSDFDFVNAPQSEQIAQAVIGIYKQAREEGFEKQLQVLTPEHKKGAGTDMLNTQIQLAMNPLAAETSRFDDNSVKGSGDFKLFANDKVIYTKNNVVEGLVNGSMGVIQEIEVRGTESIAYVRFDGDVNPQTGDDLFELRDSEIRPLALAYAMTVHKAQGSEWSNVVVIADPAHWSLRRKLLYTAITRTNNNLVIIGTEEAVARGAKRNPDEKRITLLQERLLGEDI